MAGLVVFWIRNAPADELKAMPVGADGVTTTTPYYRSTWVFVSRSRRDSDTSSTTSFDDPSLDGKRIGVPVVGEGPDTPPAIALGRRGLAAGLRAYPVRRDMAARMIEDVAAGRIDLAVLWGPSAGYFAAHEADAMTLT